MARTPSKPHKYPLPRRQPIYGFEPFQELLSQANRTPPRRKKKSIPREDADSDEEDEEDMDVESPVQYSAATPRATTSARPVSRGASADFDAGPSPRTRKSVEHAGPSRLATSLTAREQDEGEDDGGMDVQYADDFGDEANEQEPAKSPLRGKGKGKAVDDQDEEEMEDEIARSLDNSKEDASEEEEEEQSAPPRKKIRSTPAPMATQSKPKSRKQKENREVPDGVRRSKRVPYAPLEYWRGAKYVYAPREGPGRQVPYIKEILRIPKEDPAPRRVGSKRKREVIVEAVVLDYRTGTNVTRRVVFTSKMFNPIAAAGNFCRCRRPDHHYHIYGAATLRTFSQSRFSMEAPTANSVRTIQPVVSPKL
ncbi:hypothetical protein C8R44DRAFT_976614 [Mycena epipterygia]|nr:hypothetical protein C8R44DRAFT_976614 [Mycena epipterygia]